MAGSRLRRRFRTRGWGQPARELGKRSQITAPWRSALLATSRKLCSVQLQCKSPLCLPRGVWPTQQQQQQLTRLDLIRGRCESGARRLFSWPADSRSQTCNQSATAVLGQHGSPLSLRPCLCSQACPASLHRHYRRPCRPAAALAAVPLGIQAVLRRIAPGDSDVDDCTAHAVLTRMGPMLAPELVEGSIHGKPPLHPSAPVRRPRNGQFQGWLAHANREGRAKPSRVYAQLPPLAALPHLTPTLPRAESQTERFDVVCCNV